MFMKRVLISRGGVFYDDRLIEKAQGASEGRKNNVSLHEAERLENIEILDSGGTKGKTRLETDEEVGTRVRLLVSDIVANHGRRSGGANILLVSHGGVIRVLLRDVFKVSGDSPVKVFNSSKTEVEVEVHREDDSIVSWSRATLVGEIGDVSHLPAGIVTKRTDH